LAKSRSCNTAGLNDNGETFILYHWNGSPAAGAARERDGFIIMGQMTTLGGMMLPNVESWERIFPIHIGKVEFRCDGGGPGKRGGGTAVDRRDEDAGGIFLPCRREPQTHGT
jgi:N-methylhydantoinase B